jgi:hypothetical protein
MVKRLIAVDEGGVHDRGGGAPAPAVLHGRGRPAGAAARVCPSITHSGARAAPAASVLDRGRCGPVGPPAAYPTTRVCRACYSCQSLPRRAALAAHGRRRHTHHARTRQRARVLPHVRGSGPRVAGVWRQRAAPPERSAREPRADGSAQARGGDSALNAAVGRARGLRPHAPLLSAAAARGTAAALAGACAGLHQHDPGPLGPCASPRGRRASVSSEGAAARAARPAGEAVGCRGRCESAGRAAGCTKGRWRESQGQVRKERASDRVCARCTHMCHAAPRSYALRVCARGLGNKMFW